MNSLEFIEELINNIETNIYITESVLKTYDEDSDDEEEINTLKNNLEYLKERLKYSKQIKTELEAWEVVKENVNVYGHTYGSELIEYVQITEEQLPDQKHIDIIKKAKALEVTDE